jgi:hypothetical protein
VKVCDGDEIVIVRATKRPRGQKRLLIGINTGGMGRMYVECTPSQWQRIKATGDAEVRAMARERK